MADEINRASPRTQSALLQSMQEKHVTVAGKRYDLPAPFHVLATQNPLEQEGTYPLPEAQLDRFLLQIDVGYPDEAAERQIMIGTTGATTADRQPGADARRPDGGPGAGAPPADRRERGRRHPEAGACRPSRIERPRRRAPARRLGPRPARQPGLHAGGRARAIIQGRLAPSVDDVVALAGPILRHRMAVNFSARAEGITVETVIAQMCARLA